MAGTEQSLFLADFKQLNLNADRADIIKVFAQEHEGGGFNRVISVEFGPYVNFAMTQGVNEAWVLGKLEKLKRVLQAFERTYSTNFRRLGFGVNQILIGAAVVFLPSLATLLDRAILMGGVVALVAASNWLHARYLPFAAIYMRRKPIGVFARIGPSIASWLISATAGIAATLLAAYLQGFLKI